MFRGLAKLAPSGLNGRSQMHLRSVRSFTTSRSIPRFSSWFWKVIATAGAAAMTLSVASAESSKAAALKEKLKDTALDPEVNPEERFPDLPVMSLDEVAAHRSVEDGYWVTLNGCIYDITQFITTHPGGDKILAAGGASVEPFWSLYPVHYSSPLVLQHLDNLRIGVLNAADRTRMAESKRQLDANSPFKDDPERHAGLRVLQETPFNAEAPMALVGDEYITPAALWFARHHHPVPLVDRSEYRLAVGVDAPVWASLQKQGVQLKCLPSANTASKADAASQDVYSRCRVEVQGRSVTPESLEPRVRPAHIAADTAADTADKQGWVAVNSAPEMALTLADLEAMPQRQVTSTVVCAGNRRAELNQVEPTDGLTWACGAASTGEFEGVWMHEVMAALGVDEARAQRAGWNHMVMTGMDAPFDASVSANKALSPSGGCMLALRMNGEQLTRDHGYPVRALVPGYVGARNVKWTSRLQLSNEEALSPWQRGAPYKGFASAVKSFKNVDTRSMVSIQSLPVMSAITAPQAGASVEVFDCPDTVAAELKAHLNAARPAALKPSAEVYSAPAQCIEARGWAYSGDGNGIVRVDATSDQGLTWITADIERGPTKEQMEARQAWAWSLWSAAVPVPSNWRAGDQVEIAVKAMDSGFNQQPERARDVWNKRGVLNTTWHRVKYTLKADEE